MKEALAAQLDRLDRTVRDRGFVDAPPEPAPVDDVRGRAWQQVCPDRFWDASIADVDVELLGVINEWGAAAYDRNLILTGSTGTGKTHAALAVGREAFVAGRMAVEFWPVIELLDALRPSGDETVADRVADVDVLILDDIGAERPTEWTGERLAAIINRRWLTKRPTIATTNLDMAALEAALGTRTYSRLVGSDAIVYGIGGPDRRRAA